MRQLKVVVVGGGPAGAAAGLTLVKAGADVTLIDKATFPRDKCCGDGLTTAALRRLDGLGFDLRPLPSFRTITETTWRSPSGHTIDLPVPEDGLRMAVVRRMELDAALLGHAAAGGVDVREGHAVTAVEHRAGGLRVMAKDLDPIDCDYVVAADGMWSPVRRMLTGSTGYLGEIHAFRQYFTNVTGIARDRLWVAFERQLLPGYMWAFPVGQGGANIGFGITRRTGQSVAWMKQAWTELLTLPHVREALGEGATPEGPHKAWPIPAAIDTALLGAAGGRVLFVGDAARVVDPLTGEGIGQALETGELAARCIARAGADRPTSAESFYRHSIRWGMALDNRFAQSLSKLVSHEPAARAVIRLAPLGPWRGRYAIRWVLEDNPRAGLLTPWRWRERFTEKAGAYQ